MERPFLFPLTSMIAGLSTALLVKWFVPFIIIFALVPVVVCTLFIKSRIPFLITISILCFSSANLSLKPYLFPDYSKSDIANYFSEETVIIEGLIISRPEPTETGWRTTVQIENILENFDRKSVGGKLLLSVGDRTTSLVTGDRIRFSSRIRRPRNYGLPGEFNIERYLGFRNISGTVYVQDGEEIISMGDSGKLSLQRKVDMIAGSLARYISSNVAAEEATVLRALLLGQKGIVPKTLKDAYTRAGVNHILSISGFHVGIIALFVFQITSMAAKRSEFLMLRLNMRRLGLIATVPVLFFYLFLSGTAPATVRSLIMILAYIVAIALEREVDPLDSLMLAAIVILAISPTSLFDLSFQLSFLAIWGILALTPVLKSPFKIEPGRLPGKFLLFFVATVAAMAATIIPVAYYFHRTTVIGLISNYFIVPLLGYGAVVLGFSALPFVYTLPFISKLLFITAAWMVKLSNNIILILAKLPMLPVFNPTQFELGLSFLFMTAITFVRNWKLRGSCCLIIAIIYTFSAILHGSPNKGKLALTVFSMGQCESMLVGFPDNRMMLIDGGGTPSAERWDIGEKLLAPALWKMGIDSLDYMVLTHPHPDHIQGLKFIAENFPIGEFWEVRSYTDSEDYLELREILKKRRIPIRNINADTSPFKIGSVLIEPLAPFKDNTVATTDDYQELNDESMAFRIKSGEFSILFTGDIGKEVENILVRHPELLRCTVLKLPHHGSSKSSSMGFLKAASPLVAVVSAGYKNSFHLPSLETLGRLKALGIRLYRTDLDGSIQMVFEENNFNRLIIRKNGHFH